MEHPVCKCHPNRVTAACYTCGSKEALLQFTCLCVHRLYHRGVGLHRNAGTPYAQPSAPPESLKSWTARAKFGLGVGHEEGAALPCCCPATDVAVLMGTLVVFLGGANGAAKLQELVWHRLCLGAICRGRSLYAADVGTAALRSDFGSKTCRKQSNQDLQLHDPLCSSFIPSQHARCVMVYHFPYKSPSLLEASFFGDLFLTAESQNALLCEVGRNICSADVVQVAACSHFFSTLNVRQSLGIIKDNHRATSKAPRPFTFRLVASLPAGDPRARRRRTCSRRGSRAALQARRETSTSLRVPNHGSVTAQ